MVQALNVIPSPPPNTLRSFKRKSHVTGLDLSPEDVDAEDIDGLSPAQLQARVRHLEVRSFNYLPQAR